MEERVYVKNVSRDEMTNVGANESDGILLHEVAFDAVCEGNTQSQVEKVFLSEEYKSFRRRGYYTRTV